MFIHEAIYDLDELSRYNLHIHTSFSHCAKPEMTVSNIITMAEKCDLKCISLNDHICYSKDLKQHFINNEMLRKEAEKTGTKIRVLIGGEFSAYSTNNYTLKGTDFKPDYRLYAANHYHVENWEQPKIRSPYEYKQHMKAILISLFNDTAADCIAHPIYGRFSSRLLDNKYGHEVSTIGEAWSDNEIGEILLRGYNSGCAWEINTGAVLGDPKFFRRMFNIGREAGVIFNFGTDAHTLDNINTKIHINELKRILY